MTTPLYFNANWYLSQNPDVAAAIQAGAAFNAFEHFTLYGRAENRSASPVFDAQEYLRNNPDVAEAVAQGLITAWDHFELFGGAEGRSPTPLFNEAFYLQQNPDVAAAVEQGIISSAAQHFALFGQSEPRAINPAINLGQYINANPDIGQAAANGLVNVFDHLLQYGVNEGRDLGNGVSLRDFASDPGFTQALGGGKPVQALIRVETVAPFLPTFERPAGWTPRENTPIPVDFVPPADSGIKLVIPPEVVVPDDVELPETFEPVTPPAPEPGTGGGGGTTPTFTVTEKSGVVTFGGNATGDITVTITEGIATFARQNTAASQTVTLTDSTSIDLATGQTFSMPASVVTELDSIGVSLTGAGSAKLRDTVDNISTNNGAAVANLANLAGSLTGNLKAEYTTVAGTNTVASQLLASVNYQLGDFENHVKLADLSADYALAPQSVTGGNKNDTFYAENSHALMGGTLVDGLPAAGLILDGGAGTDSLIASVDAQGDPANPTPIMPTIRGVENIYLNSTKGIDGATILFSRVTDVEKLFNQSAFNNLTVTDLRKEVTLVADNTGKDHGTGSDFAIRYGEALVHSKTQKIELSDAKLNLLTITQLEWVDAQGETPGSYKSKSAGITTLDITASGHNSLKNFDETNAGAASLAKSVETIKVTGTGSLDLHELDATVKTVDASTYEGALTVTIANATDATIIGGKGDDTLIFGVNATVTGGGGKDTFVIAASAAEGADQHIKITDYETDRDVVDLTKVTNLTSLAQLDIRQGGTKNGEWQIPGEENDVVVQLSGGGGAQLILENAYSKTVEFKINDDLTEIQQVKNAFALTGTTYSTFLSNTDDGAINGGDGNEILSGGSGSQTLNGGAGNDILRGGSGEDTFQFSTNFGTDVILDFKKGEDIIDLIALSIDWTTLNTTISGANTIIDINGGNKIIVVGVNDLEARDFKFVADAI